MSTPHSQPLIRVTDETTAKWKAFFGERGFLSHYPPDVVRVVNGEPITKQDILNWKRERQAKELQRKRQPSRVGIRPCVIWTFYNQPFPYGGWWLWVKTLKDDWGIGWRGQYYDMIPKIMALYPCGLLPMRENFNVWKAAFAEQYPYPTRKRPEKQGMVVAWAKVNGRDLVDVFAERPEGNTVRI
jgi:hypothetical protein